MNCLILPGSMIKKTNLSYSYLCNIEKDFTI